jgi:hypothetical protein
MSEKAEDLTVNYSEAGQQRVEELDKQILSKGGWTTILFRYREWDPKRDAFGDDKFTIRRYQKRGGEYRQQSKFNISSRDQARQIIETLERWLKA